MASKLEFGKDAVPGGIFTNPNLSTSADLFIASRRAYAKLTCIGGLCGHGGQSIESGIGPLGGGSYESILRLSTGGRKVPPPSLTSVDFSNDGANNIYDAYLWKATVNFTCYSSEQFENLDTSFFRHFNVVVLTLGWINGVGSTSVQGLITDYQFTINEKLHFDCSVTFAGKHGIAAAIPTATNTGQPGDAIKKSGIKEFKPSSLGPALEANAIRWLGVPKVEGVAIHYSSGYGAIKVKGAVEGKTSIIHAFIPDFIYTPRQEIYYASLGLIIQRINTLMKTGLFGYEGINYAFASTEGVTKISNVKSANPYVVINGWGGENSAKYNTNLNFIAMSGDFYITTGEISKMEGENRVDKYENPAAVKKSYIELLTKILGRINEAMGNMVQLEIIPYGSAGQAEFGYEVTDRKTCITQKATPTPVDILSKNSLVRNISIQSNIDSDTAALALSSAQNPGEGGIPFAMKKGIFGTCGGGASSTGLSTSDGRTDAEKKLELQKTQTENRNAPPPPNHALVNPAAGFIAVPGGVGVQSQVRQQSGIDNTPPQPQQPLQLNSLQDYYKALTGNIQDDAELITEMMTLTKDKYSKEPGSITGYAYGVSITLTVDGNPQFIFGNTFTLSRGLPSMLRENKVYFIVLKTLHKYSNGDWTMDIEGQMLFDV